MPYLLPPVLQSGTVVRSLRQGRARGKVDDKLYEFETSFKSRSGSRRQPSRRAQTKVVVAKELAKQHATKVEIGKQSVTSAKEKKRLLGNQYNIVKSGLEVSYKAQNYAEDTWPKRFQDDPTLHKANVDYVIAVQELAHEESLVAGLEAVEMKVHVYEAEAGVKQAQEEVNKAQLAIDLCTVRAKSAGTIERVTIGNGTTLGIGTRDQALWLIPAGRRIVRAEVEADFAHRVGKDLEGKEVVVFDNTDPLLTYRGKVLYVPGTFLPKRFGGDSLFGSDTRVLEAVIEIADPAPASKPPPASAARPRRAGAVTSLERSYAECRRITSRANSSFPLAFRLLSPSKRRAMNALYAFMALPTILPDEPGATPAKRVALATWRGGLIKSIEGCYSHPVHAALADTIHRCQIPVRYLLDVIDGVDSDLEPVRFTTFGNSTDIVTASPRWSDWRVCMSGDCSRARPLNRQSCRPSQPESRSSSPTSFAIWARTRSWPHLLAGRRTRAARMFAGNVACAAKRGSRRRTHPIASHAGARVLPARRTAGGSALA